MLSNVSKKIKFIAVLFLLFNLSLTGQVANCSESKIVGEWKYVRTYGNDVNIDSLKNILSDSNKFVGIWNFKTDGTYTYQSNINKYHSKGHYKLLGSSCKMIFGKRGKETRESTSTILFLNDKYMLILKPNPHTEWIYFLSRN